MFNIVFLGDIVGTPGRAALKKHLPELRRQLEASCVVVNGENAASGRGITAEAAAEIFAAGADVITLGDHTFDQKGIEELLAGNPRIIRPANFPSGTVGRGSCTFTTAEGKTVAIINLMGRVFMRGSLDCPFQAVKHLLEQYKLGEGADAILIDIHAEATSEKVCLGHYVDGKATLVVGTHTHIPTSDAHIQPAGTAYMTDAGMCGDYNSSLGMSFPSVLPNFLSAGRNKFIPAEGEATLSGVVVSVAENGLASAVKAVKVGPHA
jgi:metallophosphoesterase (TIGR00282 family)